MGGTTGATYLWGPVISIGVVGFFILVLRWAYSSRTTTLLSARPRTGTPDEYGLLVSVAAPGTAQEGASIRDRLESAGFKVTLVETNSGLHVLVWPADAGRARTMLEADPAN